MKIRTGVGFVIAALLIIAGCSNDGGSVKPEAKAKITGSVTFTESWAQEPTDVRVVASKEFPINSFDDLVMSNTIASQGTANYEIEVEDGTYAFVGVVWKSQTNVWDLASICGVYTTDTAYSAPAGVVVDAEHQLVSGINMQVDCARARVVGSAKITGSVELTGAWPDGYASAMVVASEKDLIADSFDLLDLSMGTAMQRGETSANYSISSAATTIKSVGVIFLDVNGQISQEAMYFSQNNGGLVVEDLQVAASGTVAGPNFSMKLGSVTSAIQGTVSFVGAWPYPAEEIRLITATVFPPELDELIIGEEIAADAVNHKYTFYLPPNTYKMIGVAWRAEGTDWDVMSICGAYFVGDDSLAPAEVEIPSEDTIVKNINMVVRRDKARKATETYIAGNVSFTGAWPEGVTEARVIATTRFQIFPTIIPTMLDLAFGDPIAAGSTSYDYMLKAFPGKFSAIGVIFLKGDEQLTTNDILYSLDVGGLSLDELVVEENTVAEGPDFAIEF